MVTERSLVDNSSGRKNFVIESPTTITFFLIVLDGVFLVTLNCGVSVLLRLTVRFLSKHALSKLDRYLLNLSLWTVIINFYAEKKHKQPWCYWCDNGWSVFDEKPSFKMIVLSISSKLNGVLRLSLLLKLTLR